MHAATTVIGHLGMGRDRRFTDMVASLPLELLPADALVFATPATRDAVSAPTRAGLSRALEDERQRMLQHEPREGRRLLNAYLDAHPEIGIERHPQVFTTQQLLNPPPPRLSDYFGDLSPPWPTAAAGERVSQGTDLT